MISLARQSPKFLAGDLVSHKRYGYRGVVVAADIHCMAPEGWYQHNQTQPNKDQPWYHVLVDGGESATYAAETSLVKDRTATPITHALIDHFFDGFEDGHYTRNTQPWPGW